MRVLASTMSDELGVIYDEFVETFGFGPCGVYSVILRDRGYGQVAICSATAAGITTPHYVIVDDEGDLIDLANPFDEPALYRDVEVFGPDEMPELVDAETINWILERVA